MAEVETPTGTQVILKSAHVQHRPVVHAFDGLTTYCGLFEVEHLFCFCPMTGVLSIPGLRRCKNCARRR